ncbi:MAG: hypothetical protein A2504_02165 [Bdellovibrionales bacterium RIFOXYD12_FULL_39_22]|nr:MAG: hypothetical protein A2385_12190 [Bdellovibrionales bacterium RIFOXYB1_FULL_39_21]OFZ41401.1 MAG: hypothetical protein A2485_01360 [Bdellovibrionales bacterium RIFOXYC12_FULL_39_17]OFZ45356.1 MAG: hypothetical protein A2404_13375 [Bdellovibrionales bacterium RIFOXYC1_FULL_39_130]OFZ74552.1 MAG: hypothetical protein A2560_12480 [Bdellovibrionales bacterium RIFOXYD1_FULL_39_84]OFZ76677.1 MAG: hypothetical protein A2451_13350 [Bdellovibrionales bacterium RIFOXYC2_FULL_39_8]OFZ92561.1 MAG:
MYIHKMFQKELPLRAFLLPLIILLLIASCGNQQDKKQKADLLEEEILNALNAQDHRLALKLIDQALAYLPENLEIQYLKAQALSIKGGVDIYSLFPIVKMQLFKTAMVDWEMMRSYSSETQRYFSRLFLGQDAKSGTTSSEQKRKSVEAMNPQNISYTVEIDYISDYEYEDSSGHHYMCWANFEIDSPVFFKQTTMYEFVSTHISSAEAMNVDCEKEMDSKIKNFPEDEGELKKKIKKYALDNWDDEIEYGLLKIDERVNLFKLIYNVFESLPTLAQVPSLETVDTALLYASIDLLEKIKGLAPKKSRLNKNAKQQISVLGAYLAAAAVKDALYVEQINDMFDVGCNTRLDSFIKNYRHFSNGMHYFISASSNKKESDVSKNNNSKEWNIDGIMLNPPKELNEEQKDAIKKIIEEYKEDLC